MTQSPQPKHSPKFQSSVGTRLDGIRLFGLHQLAVNIEQRFSQPAWLPRPSAPLAIRCPRYPQIAVISASIDHPICDLLEQQGTAMPRLRAAFWLIKSSNFVGSSTGRSAGFAPFRILSTKLAQRRFSSAIWPDTFIKFGSLPPRFAAAVVH